MGDDNVTPIRPGGDGPPLRHEDGQGGEKTLGEQMTEIALDLAKLEKAEKGMRVKAISQGHKAIEEANDMTKLGPLDAAR